MKPGQTLFCKSGKSAKKRNQKAVIITEEHEINVLASVEIDLTVSVRKIANNVKISRESVKKIKIWKMRKWKKYKSNLYQAIFEVDFDRKIHYCHESRFINNEIFLKINLKYLARDNLRLIAEGNFQKHYGFNGMFVYGFNVIFDNFGTQLIVAIFFYVLH